MPVFFTVTTATPALPLVNVVWAAPLPLVMLMLVMAAVGRRPGGEDSCGEKNRNNGFATDENSSHTDRVRQIVHDDI